MPAFKAHAFSFALRERCTTYSRHYRPSRAIVAGTPARASEGCEGASETIFREPFIFLRHHHLVGLVVTTSTRDCRPSRNRAPPSGWLHGGCDSRRHPGLRHTGARFSLCTGIPTLLSTTLPPFTL
jgi:hypothetical protein